MTNPEFWLAYISIISILGGGFLWLGAFIVKANKFMDFFLREHEMLMEDYCDKKGIPVEKLPTRLPKPSWAWGHRK